MSSLVERLLERVRAEIDEGVNEPLDRLLGEAADCIERLARERDALLPRRPDPTPDKINEAFKRATRC
jgi:hypothetical protein